MVKISSILAKFLIFIIHIGELNQAIVSGKMDDTVLIQEALMDNKIADIAETIIKNNKSIVLIAGPSSSGKTSFSNRLAVHLRKYGYNAHPIACDDYFKGIICCRFGLVRKRYDKFTKRKNR